MFKMEENKKISVNRGNQFSIKLTSDAEPFVKNDKITFSVMRKGDCTDVLFRKDFIVNEECQEFFITLTNKDTKIGKPIKSGIVSYWYEIELNDKLTLIGYDDKGPKELVLYPEAVMVGDE